MRIGVLGINYRQADLLRREALARVCSKHLLLSTDSIVTLNTCNRTEIYYSAEDLPAIHGQLLKYLRCRVPGIEADFDQYFYSYFGLDCFKHLCRVTSGLDSAIVAETEILGQVKGAYKTAHQNRKLNAEMHFLFQKSLKIGKEVRKLPLGRGIPGLEHAALNAAIETFGEINPLNVLVVGASEINKKLIRSLICKETNSITLCNRKDERSKVFAAQFGLKTLSWSERNQWTRYDWIIFGTKSPHFLLTSEDVKGCALSRTLIIDLSVPRNVDPLVAEHPAITLYNIDQLNKNLTIRRRRLNNLLEKGEEIVARQSSKQVTLFQSKRKSPLQLVG